MRQTRSRPGFLIALEGIDGAGKSTQARRLAQALRERGWGVLLTREPTDGPAGKRIREAAQGERLSAEEELALFVEDRREHVKEEIAPALARGDVVILDRYYLSTAAYQGARGLPVDDIVALNESFAPIPDRVVLVDVDPSASLGRVARRGAADAFEREEDLRHCREIFLSLAEGRPMVKIFDGSKAEDELFAEILADTLGLLGAR